MMRRRFFVVQHSQELMFKFMREPPPPLGPRVVWFDAYMPALGFAASVSHLERRRARVQRADVGACGCGPPSVTDGEVTVLAADWGHAPDCGCECHLEAA